MSVKNEYISLEPACQHSLVPGGDKHGKGYYGKCTTLNAVCYVIMSLALLYLIIIPFTKNEGVDELRQRLVLLERKFSDLQLICSDMDSSSDDLLGSSATDDDSDLIIDTFDDFIGSSEKEKAEDAYYLSKETKATYSGIFTRLTSQTGLFRPKRSISNDGKPQDSEPRKTDRSKSRKKKRKDGVKTSRKRHCNQCPNSLDSLHFEAHVELDEDMQRRFDAEGKVLVPSADGHLTKQGFEPTTAHYKFWNRVSQGRGTHPDFIHISADGDHYTIKQDGIYFIYAQVLYHDLSGRWAFGIFVDDELYTQCTTSQFIHQEYIESLQESERSSHGVYMHCHTAAAVHVRDKQRVSIRSLYEGRTVVSLGKSTFWGIVKLSSIDSQRKIKKKNKSAPRRTL